MPDQIIIHFKNGKQIKLNHNIKSVNDLIFDTAQNLEKNSFDNYLWSYKSRGLGVFFLIDQETEAKFTVMMDEVIAIEEA